MHDIVGLYHVTPHSSLFQCLKTQGSGSDCRMVDGLDLVPVLLLSFVPSQGPGCLRLDKVTMTGHRNPEWDELMLDRGVTRCPL